MQQGTSCNSKEVKYFQVIGWGTVPALRLLELFLLLSISLLLPQVVNAQPQAEINDGEPSGIFGIAETAPVVINGKVRFHVVGVTAYPAERRASEISQRIEALARDTNYSPKTLRIEDAGSYHEIFPGASGKVIIRILEADAKSEGILRTVLADTIGNSIAESINDYRHDRKPAVLTKNALYALGSTIVLIVLLYGVFWGFRRVNNYLERRVKLQMQKLEERSQRIFQGGQLWGILLSALGMLRGLTVILLIYIFTNFALSLFPQTRYTAHRLYQFVVAPLGSIVN